MKTDADFDVSGGNPVHGRRVAAGILLTVACAGLFSQHIPFNWRESVLLLVGVGFIVWSALARSCGLLIPGCIMVGVGTGTLLRGEYGNAAFLLSMSGGFLLIGLLSLLMFRRRVWWCLFPAGGLAFAGLVQLAGPDFRWWLGQIRPLWPYILILVAVYLLVSKPPAK